MSWDCKDLKIYFNVNCMQIWRQLRPVEYVGADGLVYSRCEPNGMQLFDCEVYLWINIWQLTSLQRPWNTKMSSVTVLNWIYRKTRSSYPSPNVTRKWWEFCSNPKDVCIDLDPCLVSSSRKDDSDMVTFIFIVTDRCLLLSLKKNNNRNMHHQLC